MPTNYSFRPQDDRMSQLREIMASSLVPAPAQTLSSAELLQAQKGLGMKKKKSPYERPFIVKRLKDSQEKFTDVEKAFEKLLPPSQGPATQEAEGKAGKPKTGEGGSSTPYPSPQASIDWFIYKSRAGASVLSNAIESRRSLRDTLNDAVGLHQEMSAAFPPFKRFSSPDTKLTDSETALTALGKELYALCLDVDAVEVEGSPRLGFREIESSGELMKKHFSEAISVLSDWKLPLPGKTREEIEAKTKALEGFSGAITDKARDAAKSCDVEEMCKNLNDLCQNLTEMQQTYDDLICRLEFLQCLPDIEPPFLMELRAKLAQAGRYVADALQALGTIHLPEDDWRKKLTVAWSTIKQHMQPLEEAIAQWAQRQLCSPPDFCRAALCRITACVQEALSHVATLPNDRAGCETLNRQQELVECIHNELTTLAEQAGNLTDFNQRVFDPFWWPFAQIRLILSPCEEEEDPCVLTETQWKKLGEDLKTKFATASHPPQSVYRSSRSKLVNVAGAPACAAQPASVPQREPLGAQYAPYYIDTWKKSEELARGLKPFVTKALKLRIEAIITQAQREQQRLRAESTAGMVSVATLVRGVNRRWKETYEVLATAYAITLHTLTGAEKQRIAELSLQLPILNQHMKEKLGL